MSNYAFRQTLNLAILLFLVAGVGFVVQDCVAGDDPLPSLKSQTPANPPNENRPRQRIGQVLGVTIYEDQLTAKKTEAVREQTRRLFLRPLFEKYQDIHRQQLKPTEEEIEAAIKYFQKRHAKNLLAQQPDLEREIERIEANLKQQDLPIDLRMMLERKLKMLKETTNPPGEALARFLLPQQLVQMHLYQNYGGGRLLWQQFGVEAFDATVAFINEQEKLGNLKFDRAEHRDAALHYWTRLDHGSFLFDPADNPQSAEEFVNPPWLERSLKVNNKTIAVPMPSK